MMICLFAFVLLLVNPDRGSQADCNYDKTDRTDQRYLVEGLDEVTVFIRGRPPDALCVRGSVRLLSPG